MGLKFKNVKLQQDSKVVIKPNLNYDKTHLKFREKKNYENQFVTKNSNSDKTLKSILERTTWHLDIQWDVLRAAFFNLTIFVIVFNLPWHCKNKINNILINFKGIFLTTTKKHFFLNLEKREEFSGFHFLVLRLGEGMLGPLFFGSHHMWSASKALFSFCISDS